MTPLEQLRHDLSLIDAEELRQSLILWNWNWKLSVLPALMAYIAAIKRYRQSVTIQSAESLHNPERNRRLRAAPSDDTHNAFV